MRVSKSVMSRSNRLIPQKAGILQSFRAIAGNRPLFILCVANLCTLAAFNVKLAIQVYYTQYVLNDPILLSYMGFFSMGCIFIGVFLMPTAVRRFGKKKSISADC